MIPIVAMLRGSSRGKLSGDCNIREIDKVRDSLGREACPGQTESDPFNQIDLPEEIVVPAPVVRASGKTAARALQA